MRHNKDLVEFIKETLAFGTEAAKTGLRSTKSDKVTHSDKPDTKNKLDVIHMTARKLKIEPELVKAALESGGISGIFKKKNEKLTPELVKKVKETFKGLNDA